VGAPTEIGRRLTNALAYSGSTETTVLLEEPETLDAYYGRMRKRGQRRKRKKPGQDSPCSRTGHV